MNSATDVKNINNVETGSTTAGPTKAGISQDDDMVTIRIPKQIKIEMPRSFQFEIPQWAVNLVILTGVVSVLHLVTGGRIWHFWWLIFFVMPWLTGQGYSCSGKKKGRGMNSWNDNMDSVWDKPKPSKRPKPSPTGEMYV